MSRAISIMPPRIRKSASSMISGRFVIASASAIWSTMSAITLAGFSPSSFAISLGELLAGPGALHLDHHGAELERGEHRRRSSCRSPRGRRTWPSRAAPRAGLCARSTSAVSALTFLSGWMVL